MKRKLVNRWGDWTPQRYHSGVSSRFRFWVNKLRLCGKGCWDRKIGAGGDLKFKSPASLWKSIRSVVVGRGETS